MPPDSFSELINWFLFFLLTALDIIVMIYFLREWSASSWRALHRTNAGAITIAIFALVLGVGGDRMVYAVVRHVANHGDGIGWFSPYAVGITLVSTTIAAMGAACAIRVMGPDRFGHWLWSIIVLASLGAAVWLSAP